MNTPDTAADVLWHGRLPASAVRCHRTSHRYTPPTHLAPHIDAAWHHGLNSGLHLFDGPMVRLDRLDTAQDTLTLHLGELSYKPFYALHMARPDLLPADESLRPNPLGVSAALLTADRRLLLGRRSPRVAYYPNRLHPVAGAMEPADPDPFAAARRETAEELHIPPDALTHAPARLIALLRDPHLRQPEAVILLHLPLPAHAISPDGTEHDALLAVDPVDADPPDATPVCRALLHRLRTPLADL